MLYSLACCTPALKVSGLRPGPCLVLFPWIRNFSPHYLSLTRGLFLKNPDNFPGPVSVFSSSFIYQLMAIIGANV